jgi:putative CocE/NonD family hydrolase
MRREAPPNAADEQYLLIGPWNHYPPRTGTLGSARVGELDFGLDAIVNMDRIQLRWFDRHLRGDAPPPFRKRVRLFVMGANVWRDEDDWPVERATATHWFLGGDGRAATDGGTLSTDGSVGSRPDVLVGDPARPVPTTGGAHLLLETQYPQGPRDQRAVEARDDVLVYTSPPLDADLEVTGWIEARLWVASDAPSADVVVRLVTVLPDGRAIGLADGIRRLAMDPGGDPVEVVVDLGAISYRFAAGEAIRLDVAGSNFPRFDLNLHTGERAATSSELLVARHTVFHEPGRESALVLPVVPGG